MKALFGFGVSVVALIAATSAHASAVIDLNFEGINSTYPSSNYAFINDFYNGGMSSDGTTGPNFGIVFSPNAQAICLNSSSASCSNTSKGGLGDPNSQKAACFSSVATQPLWMLLPGSPPDSPSTMFLSAT